MIVLLSNIAMDCLDNELVCIYGHDIVAIVCRGILCRESGVGLWFFFFFQQRYLESWMNF